MQRQWRLADSNNHYYHQTNNGLIVGHVYNLAHTIVWGAKIPINAAEDLILGKYIEMEYAKRAVEEYWDETDRTINYNTQGLITRHEL